MHKVGRMNKIWRRLSKFRR